MFIRINHKTSTLNNQLNMSFKNKILLWFVLLLVIALLAPFWYFKHNLQQEILNEASQDARRHLQHIHWVLHREQGLNTALQLQNFVSELAQGLDLRITLINEQGLVLADSMLDFAQVPEMDDHSLRPEVEQAMSGLEGLSVRYSNTMQTDFIYVAQEISELGIMNSSGVLRVALPYSHVQSRLQGFTAQQGYVLLCSLAFAFLLSWFLARQLSRTILNLSRAAAEMGQVNLQKRIDFYPAREFRPLVDSLNHMAQSIESHIQTISSQKQELEAILNGLQEGVMVLDDQCRIVSGNQAVQNIFQFHSSLLGKTPIEVVRSLELQETCESAARTPQEQVRQLFLSLPGRKYFQVHIIPVHSKLAQPGRVVVVFHDISELKRLEQLRKDFVANVSHELRTPLTSIQGYAETLEYAAGLDQETLRSFAEIIHKNSRHMSRMVQDLLQLARLESQEDQLQLQKIDLKSALYSAWETCSVLARDKEIRLEEDFPEFQVMVWAEPDQLHRVLLNLLQNAIQYSPAKESIQVGIQQEKDGWVFAVRDKGPGVVAADQDRIFERFYRVREQENQVPQGSGLGLSISKHIINKMQGRIWMQSPAPNSDQGSVFYFSLPRAD